VALLVKRDLLTSVRQDHLLGSATATVAIARHAINARTGCVRRCSFL
jgi:hypothetical protein